MSARTVQSAGAAAELPRTLSCWVVTEGMAGTENQCLGLAEALGLQPDVKRIAVRAPWRWLPPRLWPAPLAALSPAGDALAPPWPDLLIASGRKAAAPALAVRRASAGRTFTVCVQDPRLQPDRFDAVVAPQHDGLSGANVIATVGAPTRVTRKRLAEAHARFAALVEDLPRPRVAVLVGGSSRAHRLTPEIAQRLADQLRTLAETTGCGLMVTTSRRTGAANAARLRHALAGTPHRFYAPGGAGENPYFGFLAHADQIVVTGDSVTMASEAAAAGRPLHVVELSGGKPKFDRFHAQLRELGVARAFDGTLAERAPAALDDTRRAANKVRRMLAAHRAKLADGQAG